MPHTQIHKNLVQFLHPQIPLVLSVCTQPVPAHKDSQCSAMWGHCYSKTFFHTDRYSYISLDIFISLYIYEKNYRDLLGDTHGILALTDKCLFVVLSLWSHCDELKCVGSGAELSVGWFHLVAGAVG